MNTQLDKVQEKCYQSIRDLTVNERAIITEVRSLESGHVTICIDRGNITHIKIEQTKKL